MLRARCRQPCIERLRAACNDQLPYVGNAYLSVPWRLRRRLPARLSRLAATARASPASARSLRDQPHVVSRLRRTQCPRGALGVAPPRPRSKRTRGRHGASVRRYALSCRRVSPHAGNCARVWASSLLSIVTVQRPMADAREQCAPRGISCDGLVCACACAFAVTGSWQEQRVRITQPCRNAHRGGCGELSRSRCSNPLCSRGLRITAGAALRAWAAHKCPHSAHTYCSQATRI